MIAIIRPDQLWRRRCVNHSGGTATACIILSGSRRAGRAAQSLDEVTVRSVMFSGNTETRQRMCVAGNPGANLPMCSKSVPQTGCAGPQLVEKTRREIVRCRFVHCCSICSDWPPPFLPELTATPLWVSSSNCPERWTICCGTNIEHRNTIRSANTPAPDSTLRDVLLCTRRPAQRHHRILTSDGNRLCGTRTYPRILYASQQPWKLRSEPRSLASTPSCQSTR